MKLKSFMLWIASAGFTMGLLLGLVSCRSIAWKAVKYKVRDDFPRVKRIQSRQLAEWLNDSGREPPLLLDVRTEAEYEVSHLHGAQRVEPGSLIDQVNIPADKPIVTYCSVGYRSAAFAQKLQEGGFKNVQNLEGSIFEWANDGRPVVRDAHRAEKVHPYNQTWGKLLKPQVRADLPRRENVERWQ